MISTRCAKCFGPAIGGVDPDGWCLEHAPLAAPQSPKIERGKVYDTAGPNGEKIVVMLHDTWLDFGTNYQSARQVISNLTKRLGEANAGEKAALLRLADTQTRLENLRAVRRAEKRPEIEGQLAAIGILPTETQG